MGTNAPFVASGFKEDCIKLIQRFEQFDNVRFQDFSQIWKEMQFSLIFTCRPSSTELAEFCEEAMHIAKLFLLPPYKFKERVAGLYLVYALYYKIPIDNVKVRVKQEDWIHIVEFQSIIEEAEHQDANFILSKLIIENAFVHCVFDHEYGLEKYLRTKKLKKVKRYSVLPMVEDLLESGCLLTNVSNFSKLYHEKKCGISKSKKPERGLELYDIDYVHTLFKEIHELTDHTENSSMESSNLLDEDIGDEDSKEETSKLFSMRCGLNKVRPKVGHGFDTDTSDDDDSLTLSPLEDYDSNLSEDLKRTYYLSD
ncbi:snRNA-activating protein complex subunit 1 isoform X2 [Cephus cinctus]|uniref:snRNA-activating protein complex subunit 1 isoform X2 n=1 Tax=Cephus cinctus TaxID=211228 RepID=A0AAJ7C7J9_CEPCN|nr:snRNA-activating protein complex subunit 1 isoform X2 [Cephus cinctus]